MRTEVTFVSLLALASCAKGPASPPHALEAKVENAVPEAALATVRLSIEAERRLGIETAKVSWKEVQARRKLAGDVVVPTGRSWVVTAPIAGTVLPMGAALPSPGAKLTARQPVLKLFGLPSAADLAAAESRLTTAKKRAQRASELLKEGAVAERANEDAQLELALAQANLDAARPGSRSGSERFALPMFAPRAGMLRELRVGEGQTVAAGTPLFQLDALDEVWVRVALPAGEVRSVPAHAIARVGPLMPASSQAGANAEVEAPRVDAPPSADPLAATVDVFFLLSNAGAGWQAGERVWVTVPMGGEQNALTAPWSSIVYDVQGGAWVYQALGAQKFARQRVEVLRREGEVAVLASGPKEGTLLVRTGVAELFGVEFGAGK